MRPTERILPAYPIACVLASLACFACGFLVYLACRPLQPALFTALGIAPSGLLARFAHAPASDWLPSFTHVAAFSLATCSLFPPGFKAAVWAGGSWAGANIGWELSCLRPGAVGRFDPMDIGAAILGMLATMALAAFFIRLFPTQAKERT